jgi:hypothetical protein
MDWKSIENANMATIGFKQQLLDTAVALGTVKKQADGTYKTLEGGEVVSATNNFNGSLEKQWLTTAVLTSTLADYASQETEIGKKANSAAQDVKTFSQLMATVQDSVKTGWTKSWQLVVGDLFQSTALFTEINNIVSGFTGASAKARNDLLQGFVAFNGRISVIDSLRNIFNALLAVMKPIREAFAAIFPPTTAYQLASIAYAFKQFTDKLMISEGTAYLLKRVFEGLFSIFRIGQMAIMGLADWFGKLLGSIAPTSAGFEKIAIPIAIFADKITRLKDQIEFAGFGFIFGEQVKKLRETYPIFDQISSKFDLVVQTITTFVANVKAKFSEMVPSITSSIDKLRTSVTDFFGFKAKTTPFEEALKNLSKTSSKVFDEFGAKTETRFSPFSKMLEGLGGVLNWIGQVIGKLAPVFGKLGELAGKGLSALGTAIMNGFTNLDYNAIFDGLNSGLIAALILAVTSFINRGNLIIGPVTGILNGVQNSLQTWQTNLKASTLMTIAGAIGILVLSVIALSMVDSKKLTQSMTAMTVMFGELMGSMSLLDKSKGGSGVEKAAGQMILLSIAVLTLSLAVRNLSKIKPEELTAGLIGVGVILAELTLFMKLTDTGTKGSMQAGGLLLLAVAVNLLGIAVKKFSEMDPEKMKQGLLAVGAVLTELALFVNTTGNAKNVVGTGIGLTILAASMLIFGEAISKMGSMPIATLVNGLLAMAASLAIVTVAVNLMPKNMIVSAVSLVVVAGALLIIAKAMAEMGKMSWDEIARGLAAMAGALLLLTVAMYGMTDGLPGAAAMLVMAAALAIFVPVLKTLASMSLQEIGLGLLALAGIFAVVGLAGLILGPITWVIVGLSAALLLFGLACTAVGIGMITFSMGLGALALSGAAGVSVITLFITTLIGLIPMLAIGLAKGLVQFAVSLAESAPLLSQALSSTIMTLVNMLVTLIPTVVQAAMNLLSQLLQALVSKIPEIVQAGMDIVLALLNGIANNIGRIVAAAVDIVRNFLLALGTELPKIVDAGWKMIISFIEGITASIKDNLPALIKAFEDLGQALMDGIIKPIKDGASNFIARIVGMATDAWEAAKRALGIKSPSKKFMMIGTAIVDGWVKGIVQNGSDVENAVTDLGLKSINSMGGAISQIADAINGNMDMSPSIRPVVDLSDVIAGGRQIDNLFGQKNLNVSGSINKVSAVSSLMPGSTYRDDRMNQQPMGQGTSLVYTQNNYSPKSLSPLEIYRQTKNQLRSLKGLVGTS